jgi:hypothetical protein
MQDYKSMQNINSTSIKISRGKVEVDRELSMGQEVELVVKGTVVQKTFNDNQDGTEDLVFTVKAVSVKIS